MIPYLAALARRRPDPATPTSSSVAPIAHDRLVAAVWDIATGHVIIDQHLVDLGYQGADAYVKDEKGAFIPKAVCPPNPKMLRFLLELLRPDEWGEHRKIDVPHKGGVLVVGYIAKKPEYSTAASVKAMKWKSCSRRIREAKA